MLYEAKTSVDVEEELVNCLNCNYRRRLRPMNGRCVKKLNGGIECDIKDYFDSGCCCCDTSKIIYFCFYMD